MLSLSRETLQRLSLNYPGKSSPELTPRLNLGLSLSLQCLLTINRESCYCRSVYSTNYGCEPIERGAHIPINRTECLSILETGVYQNEYFTITGIKPNKMTIKTYISKGDRNKYGTCRSVNYVRNGHQYEYSYERSTAQIMVEEISLRTTTGLTPESPTDIILPNNLQLPVTAKEAMSPLFGTIAWEEPELGCSDTSCLTSMLKCLKDWSQFTKKPM